MSKQEKRTKTPVLIVVSVVALTLLTASGIFGLKAYQNYRANKIYAVDQTMNYPDFNVEVTKAETKPVDLPLSKELLEKYGGLDNQENCESFSKTSTITIIGGERLPYGPSDYHLCNRRNSSRHATNDYIKNNRQFVIDYKIIAKGTVNTRNIKIKLIPDSGRKLGERVNELNSNEFIQESTFEFNGARISRDDGIEYTPYFQKEIGENISKGITRTGYLYTDVQNGENTIDFIMSYEKDGTTHTRIMRINIHQN